MQKLVLTALAVCTSIGSYAQLGQLGGLAKKAAGMAPQSAAGAAGAQDNPTQGVTGPVHAKNMGKIVFASGVEALTFQKENEAAFGTTFTLGKPIYFRAYMANSLSNLVQRLLPDISREIIDTHAVYKMKFYLDGAMAYENVLRDFTEEQKQYTSFKGALQSEGEEYNGGDLFRLFVAENETKLTKGAHKLKIELTPFIDYPEEKEGAVMAAGEIALNVGASTANASDTKTCLPATGMKDAALEAKMMEAFKAKGWSEKPSAVRITGSRWNIIHHEVSGVILKRSVSAVVASTLKNGGCQYQSFLFSEEYDGTAYQDAVFMDGIGSPTTMPCGCLK